MSISQGHLVTYAAWVELCIAVPALRDLEAAVQLMRPDPDDADCWHGYRAWSRRLAELVGWHAPPGHPRDSASYSVAHDHLLAVWEGAR